MRKLVVGSSLVVIVGMIVGAALVASRLVAGLL
jgi:hypothetical protein